MNFELVKALNYLVPSYLWEVFLAKQVVCNLSTKNLVVLPQIRMKRYGINFATFRSRILWSAFTDDIKLVVIWQLLKRK